MGFAKKDAIAVLQRNGNTDSLPVHETTITAPQIYQEVISRFIALENRMVTGHGMVTDHNIIFLTAPNRPIVFFRQGELSFSLQSMNHKVSVILSELLHGGKG